MRICLVIPPSITGFGDGAEVRSESLRHETRDPPLGILSLAAILLERNYFVDVVDLNRAYYEYLDCPRHRQDFSRFAAEAISSTGADVIGFGSICSSYPFTIRAAQATRELMPGKPILVGGPQASVVDEATMEEFEFIDFVLRGEAEETLPALLRNLDEGTSFEQLFGLTYRSRRQVRRNPNARPIEDLDGLPLPAFHLFPDMSVDPSLSLEVGRGCPFSCNFCSTNDFFRRRFRLKSPETIVRQMQLLTDQYRPSAFDFVHDMFTVDRRRVILICDAIRNCGRKFYWSCSARTDCVDESLLNYMAGSGCTGVFFGVETGSARMQHLIEKDLDLEAAHRMIETCDRLHIRTTVSVIFGFPEETREDVAGTASFLVRAARFDWVDPQSHLLAPLAATPMLTKHREQLYLDDVFSDMSHQGWMQHPADRVLIGMYPDIFPNFYGLPTGVNRGDLRELTLFLHFGLLFHRWVLIALNRVVSVLTAYETWMSWFTANRPGRIADRCYYESYGFPDDFVEHVTEAYPRVCPEYSAIRTLARFSKARVDAMRDSCRTAGTCYESAPTAVGPSYILRLAPGAVTFRAEGDVPLLIAALREEQAIPHVDHAPRVFSVRQKGWRVELAEESEFSALALRLCDSTRTVDQAVDEMSAAVGTWQGISGRTVAVHALARLMQRGLVAARPGASPEACLETQR